jgi:hypothetical protein
MAPTRSGNAKIACTPASSAAAPNRGQPHQIRFKHWATTAGRLDARTLTVGELRFLQLPGLFVGGGEHDSTGPVTYLITGPCAASPPATANAIRRPRLALKRAKGEIPVIADRHPEACHHVQAGGQGEVDPAPGDRHRRQQRGERKEHEDLDQDLLAP